MENRFFIRGFKMFKDSIDMNKKIKRMELDLEKQKRIEEVRKR